MKISGDYRFIGFRKSRNIRGKQVAGEETPRRSAISITSRLLAQEIIKRIKIQMLNKR